MVKKTVDLNRVQHSGVASKEKRALLLLCSFSCCNGNKRVLQWHKEVLPMKTILNWRWLVFPILMVFLVISWWDTAIESILLTACGEGVYTDRKSVV